MWGRFAGRGKGRALQGAKGGLWAIHAGEGRSRWTGYAAGGETAEGKKTEMREQRGENAGTHHGSGRNYHQGFGLSCRMNRNRCIIYIQYINAKNFCIVGAMIEEFTLPFSMIQPIKPISGVMVTIEP